MKNKEYRLYRSRVKVMRLEEEKRDLNRVIDMRERNSKINVSASKKFKLFLNQNEKIIINHYLE